MALKVGELFATMNLDDSGFSEGLQNAKGSALSAVGEIAKTLGLLKLGKDAFSAFADFESAFAGVKKTVDETANTSYADLEQAIIDMSKVLPASATEIAAVAEAAGQLGIGADNIEDFTQVMIDLGESTNMTADEAATTLARFANIMGTAADEYSNLGSTIVDLGNSYATTESEIAAMAMRIAGAGKQIGMSESDVFGFAAAFSSVGIEAEAGGSAFSTFASNLSLAVSEGGEDLSKYAKVAGMSSQEFQKAFGQDATGAILSFITGLGKAEDGIGVLAELGVTEIRQRDALLRAAGASDIFTDSVQTANSAYIENNALSAEAAKRYETIESRIAMLKNQVTEMARQFGAALVPAFERLLPVASKIIATITDLPDQVKSAVVGIGALLVAIGPAKMLLSGMGGAIYTVGGLLGAMLNPITLVVGGMALLYKKSDRVQVIIEKLKKTFKTLWTFLKKGKGPIDSIYNAIRAGFGEDLSNAVFPILEKIRGAWQNMVEWIQDSAKWIRAAFSVGKSTGGLFGGMVAAAQTAWARLKLLFKSGWTALTLSARSVGSKLFEAIRSAIASIRLKVSEWISGVDWSGLWDKAKGTTSNLKDSLSEAISAVRIKVADKLSGVDWDGIWDGIVNTADSLKIKTAEILGKIPGIVGSFISDVKNFTGNGKFAELGEKLIEFIAAVIQSKAGGGAAKIISAISGLFKGITIGSISNELSDALGNIGNVMIRVISTGISAAANGATSLIQAVGELLHAALSKENLNATVGALSNIGGTIIDVLAVGIQSAANGGTKIINAISNIIAGNDWANAGAQIGVLATNLVKNITDKIGTTDFTGFSASIGSLLAKASVGLLGACTGLATTIVGYILSADAWVSLLKGLWSIFKAILTGIGMYIKETVLGWDELISSHMLKETDVGFDVNLEFLNTDFTDTQAQQIARDAITQVQYALANNFSKEEVELLISDIQVSFGELGLSSNQIQELNSSGLFEAIESMVNQYFADNPVEASAKINGELETIDGGMGSIEAQVSQIQNEYAQELGNASPIQTDIPIDPNIELSASQITEFSSEGINAGQALGYGVASGISFSSDSVDSAVSDVVASVKSTLSAATASVRTSGLNISRGLAQGILAGKSAVISAAKQVMQAAIRSANSEAQIHSPSRVMMRSGVFFGEGFASGIVDSAASVSRAASAMAQTAIRAASISNPGARAQAVYAGGSAGAPAAIDYDRLADAMSQRPMVLTQNGRVVATVQARDNAIARNGIERRYALGYGK